MVFTAQLFILFGVALVVSSMGFKKYVWFISLGYGFSIAAEGIALLIMFPKSPLTIAACLMFIVYGCRLGGYLAFRELKSGSYSKHMKGEIKEDVPIGVKVAIWVTCAILYVLQVTPVLYRLQNGAPDNVWLGIGVAVMVCGVVLESAADLQKNRAKKANPRRFVDTGLYRIVRCPNYLGELVFWTGVVISGVGAVAGVGQWILVLLGYLGIVFVMFSGARRLEVRQNKNYGSDPEYREYTKTVPILIPFVPLYSVEKYKWLVA
jgi:steroid 5-alpha reductase family enzyme